MTKYKMYYTHDPIGNYESQLSTFDQAEIQKAMDNGFIIIGVTQEGNREIIKSASEVVQPEVFTMKGIPMVLPSYVDTRIDALAMIIDNLVEGVSSQMPVKNLASIKKQLNAIHVEATKTVEEEATMLASNPILSRPS